VTDTLSKWLPIFPLNTVLFPEGLLPLRIFEARYMDMARASLKSKEPFGVCLIKEGKEVGAPAVPEAIGSLAHIVECDMEQLGLLNIVTRGGQRFRILERTATPSGLIRAQIEMLPAEEDATVPEAYLGCARLLEMIMREHGEKVISAPPRLSSATWVGYRLTEILPVSNSAKQKMLELEGSIPRLEILHRYLDQRGLLRDQ
jgi:uncharacterized protein